jgi:DNA-binding transcriptional MerR regulator
MSIGEFARRSRLSPKALRVYDGLGLLSPARVDELSGYRYYEEAQLEQARLIATLRQVGVPLGTVKELLALEPAEMAEQVTGFWREAETRHAGQRELVTALVDRLTGRNTVMYEVASREMPQRSLLCLKRNVDESGAWAFGKEFIAVIRDQRLPTRRGRRARRAVPRADPARRARPPRGVRRPRAWRADQPGAVSACRRGASELG